MKAKFLDQDQISSLESFKARDGFNFLEDEELHDMLELFKDYDFYKPLFPILTDNNSNYWCVYIIGPLKGMVCYLSHDELSLDPKFYNISQLINAIQVSPDCYDYEELAAEIFDFPLINKNQHEALFTQIKSELYQYLKQSDDEDYIRQITFSIMALITTDEAQELYKFLESDDEYIVERASKISAMK